MISRSLDQKGQTCLQIFGSHLSTDFQVGKIENVSVLSRKLGKLFTLNALRFSWSNQGIVPEKKIDMTKRLLNVQLKHARSLKWAVSYV